MLYTIIDIYEVLRTDEIYPQAMDSVNDKTERICTDAYVYLKMR